jgi:hypothetical protein
MGEITNSYKTFVGKHEEKRPDGIPRHSWEDTIGLEIGRESADWIHLAQWRDQGRDQWRVLVNTEINLRVP